MTSPSSSSFSSSSSSSRFLLPLPPGAEFWRWVRLFHSGLVFFGSRVDQSSRGKNSRTKCCENLQLHLRSELLLYRMAYCLDRAASSEAFCTGWCRLAYLQMDRRQLFCSLCPPDPWNCLAREWCKEAHLAWGRGSGDIRWLMIVRKVTAVWGLSDGTPGAQMSDEDWHIQTYAVYRKQWLWLCRSGQLCVLIVIVFYIWTISTATAPSVCPTAAARHGRMLHSFGAIGSRRLRMWVAARIAFSSGYFKIGNTSPTGRLKQIKNFGGARTSPTILGAAGGGP